MEINREELKKKWWEFKHDAEIKIRSGINWAKEHKEICISGAIVGERILSSVVKYAKKSKQERLVEEQRLRLWDPRKGRFSYYRRKLSNNEWDYIDREYEKGRSYREILDEMGLLK